jgi:hypothetical protein
MAADRNPMNLNIRNRRPTWGRKPNCEQKRTSLAITILTESPAGYVYAVQLLQLVDQLFATAEVERSVKK